MVFLTSGKTKSRSSPSVGHREELYVERWTSYLEDGLYGTPMILEDIFGNVVVGEKGRWMRGVMEMENWLLNYRMKKCIK